MRDLLGELLFWLCWTVVLTVAVAVAMFAVTEWVPQAQPLAGYVVTALLVGAMFWLILRRTRRKRPERYAALRALVSHDPKARRAQVALAVGVVIGVAGVILLGRSAVPEGWRTALFVALGGGTFVLARIANRRTARRLQAVKPQPPIT